MSRRDKRHAMKTARLPCVFLALCLVAASPPGTQSAPRVGGGVFEQDATGVALNDLDARVLAALRKQDIAPAPVCSDAVFVRRVFLDVIGTLPTAAEAR
ncbi:MAG: DUF1549 domain-containing protein, partial [Verrucomicrobia bacterium]|nr:DUF1549 domain-containing protein [Verrucomicrobiota bacterium]